MDLNIYKKGDSKPAFTGDETTGVAITGLAAGTSVAAGDYQVSAVDPVGKMTESDKVDVPDFTVNKAKAPAPANLKVTPTNDGAMVTAQ